MTFFEIFNEFQLNFGFFSKFLHFDKFWVFLGLGDYSLRRKEEVFFWDRVVKFGWKMYLFWIILVRILGEEWL